MGMFILSLFASSHASEPVVGPTNEPIIPNIEITEPNPVLSEKSEETINPADAPQDSDDVVDSERVHAVTDDFDDSSVAGSTVDKSDPVETEGDPNSSDTLLKEGDTVNSQTEKVEKPENKDENEDVHISESANKPISQSGPTMEEAKKTFDDFLVKLYGVNQLPGQSFEVMWRLFEGDLHRILIFLTHCTHNTSGFQNLTGNDNSEYAPYISRGILQITGLDNYEIAGKKYVENPKLMASCDSEEVEAAVKVYLDIVPRDSQSTFYDSLIHLKPEEVQGENFSRDAHKSLIENRAEIYRKLTSSFDRTPIFGECPEISSHKAPTITSD